MNDHSNESSIEEFNFGVAGFLYLETWPFYVVLTIYQEEQTKLNSVLQCIWQGFHLSKGFFQKKLLVTKVVMATEKVVKKQEESPMAQTIGHIF